MNMAQRFPGRSTHEALAQVRRTLGDDAVVITTRRSNAGVEVLAMAAEAFATMERDNAASLVGAMTPVNTMSATPERGSHDSTPSDADMLALSTLSFQDYVRDRMRLKRRQELGLDIYDDADAHPAAKPTPQTPAPTVVASTMKPSEFQKSPTRTNDVPTRKAPASTSTSTLLAPSMEATVSTTTPHTDVNLLQELRHMRNLIEARFHALAHLGDGATVIHASVAQSRLQAAGWSTEFSRSVVAALPEGATDDDHDLVEALASKLMVCDRGEIPEASTGVYALVGPTGVGKTTTTAKIAAAHVARHGAVSLALVTLDSQRAGGHEALRAWGRMLGVAVHTAHDQASLEDLLSLFGGKRLVLIDTVGLSHRASEAKESLALLSHPSIRRILVLPASAQAETLEDVLNTHRSPSLAGVVISKTDEAVRLAPALEVLIRHGLRLLGVANGQRVPEDWHHPEAHELMVQALGIDMTDADHSRGEATSSEPAMASAANHPHASGHPLHNAQASADPIRITV